MSGIKFHKFFSGAYRAYETKEINFSSYATVVGTVTVPYLWDIYKTLVVKYKTKKCTFSKGIFEFLNVYYIFRNRGFIFRKTVINMVWYGIVWYNLSCILKLKLKPFIVISACITYYTLRVYTTVFLK